MLREGYTVRQNIVETKIFTIILFSVAIILGVAGLLSGLEPLLMLCLVVGVGALIKLLAVDL
jgi:hypothetical protein